MSSMTRMMDSPDRRGFMPRGPPYAQHPDYHRRPGPGPTQTTIPRRYEPYRSTIPIPHRLTRPPSIDIPRLPPAPHSTPSPPGIRTGPKNYDPLRPEGLYQASKGARRDMKWMQKNSNSERPGHSPPRHSTQPDVTLPPYYQPRPPIPHTRRHEDRSRVLPLPTRQGFPIHPIRGGIHRLNSISPHDRGREAVPFTKRASGASAFGAKGIKEQQDVIAAARVQYIREKQEQKKSEWERKVKRIQMQVFVHARPTPCPWGSCPALLNSWALLEKHLLHSHLHPQSKGMPAPGKPVQCNFRTCDQVFGTGNECYQHCLSAHMGSYGARCPFNCAFEGPSFDELMAHIGRRHRKATPDDFVPGLIHHFPPSLPPASALPKLSDSIPITPLSDAHITTPTLPNGQVQPYEDPSPKVVSLVGKKCFSQRKPLPEKYAKMKGASAAIAAIVENVQRERLSTRGIPTSNLRRSLPNDEEANEATDVVQGSAQAGLYHSPQGKELLDLIDVDAEKRRAEKEAKAVIKGLIDSGDAISSKPEVHRFWTRSHSGESDSNVEASTEEEKNNTWYTTRRQSRILSKVKKRTLELSDDSESATDDAGSDSASASSAYVPQRKSVDLLPPVAVRTRLLR